MIDRTKAPELNFSKIKDFFSESSLAPENILIKEIPCYIVDRNEQDLVKIELIFDAGSIYQTKPFVAFSTFQMLTEGTKSMTSAQISEKLDFYGSFLEKEVERDFASVSLYTLNKHLKSTLPILFDVLANPIFPAEELSIFKDKQKSLLEVNKKQVSYLARTHFTEILYGKTHPYGYKIELDDIEKINIEDLAEFRNKHICPNKCKIIISGKITEEIIQIFEDILQNFDWININHGFEKKEIKIKSNNKFSEHVIEQPNVVQSAIRIGKILFNYQNPEYNKFNLLNTILGGYFGSRLMKNLREEKGYTYGIGSTIISFNHSGYFFITTEVGKEYTKAAISEIYKEIEKLQNEKVDYKELDLVKNYKYGELMRSIDGTFAVSEYIKKVVQYNLPIDYINRVFNEINETNNEDIMLMAQKYLDKDILTQLVVGKLE